jgi:prevent-host-death family protein
MIHASDYSGYMIATLRESKAHLSALVEKAAQGEEVIITVRGKPKARLCPIPAPAPLARRDAKRWAMQLREARATYTVKARDSSSDILDELRGDRA